MRQYFAKGRKIFGKNEFITDRVKGKNREVDNKDKHEQKEKEKSSQGNDNNMQS